MRLTLITNPISLKNGALYWQFDKQMAWLPTSHPAQHSTLNMGKTSLLSLRNPCPLKWANYQKRRLIILLFVLQKTCKPASNLQSSSGYVWVMCTTISWICALIFSIGCGISYGFSKKTRKILPLDMSQPAWYWPKSIINEDTDLNILWEHVCLTTISQ